MKKNELDHIDFEILKMLQANARGDGISHQSVYQS